MHRAHPSISRAITGFHSYAPCRVISGRRYPSLTRAFHATKLQHASNEALDSDSGKTADTEAIAEDSRTDKESSIVDYSRYEQALRHGQSLLSDADQQWPGIADWSLNGHSVPVSLRERIRRDKSGREGKVSTQETKIYGSWRKRAMRNMKGETISLSLPKLPQWFYDRDVKLNSEIPDNLVQLETAFQNISPENYADAVRCSADEDSGSHTSRYRIDKDLFTEIESLARAGLRSANTEKEEDVSISRPHLVLQSPQEGGLLFLSHVARNVAKNLEADIIQIGPSSISELVMDMGLEIPEKMVETLKTLGYDSRTVDNDLIEEDEDGGEEEDTDGVSEPRSIQSVLDNLMRRSKSGSSSRRPPYKFNVVIPRLVGIKAPFEMPGEQSDEIESLSSSFLRKSKKEDEDVLKVDILFETFLDSVILKRSSDSKFDTANTEQRNPLVIIIDHYLEMQTTRSGGALLDKLHTMIQQRRRDGQEILVIGLTTSEDLIPSSTTIGLQRLQIDSPQGPYRTIITSPSNWASDTVFEHDEKVVTTETNIRHLQDMLRRLAWKKDLLGEWCWKIASEVDQTPFGSYFEEAIWSANRLSRVAAVSLGLVNIDSPKVDEKMVGKVLKLVIEGDEKKFALLDAKQEEALEDETSSSSTVDPSSILSKVRKNANAHEKKMLHGVIDRKDIKTTFSSVHVPEPTIQALKTLTSLSLHRPDAFAYGVLANDKIPGLLLYGPPGTGKTLLAKAVAGESGATVLEISGSDIYDMYVGEGEKNVRAIFTLAQKLSPCVVFLDEADAILGSRNSSTNRTTHRELINQFLREWDGLSSKNSSAFIMVATNRPFDLDDAVLRRLPRRLLVDLPTEKDREAILKIHLADEKLDDSVSLSSLAERTPFYSGSDLKNVCVAAALQAVQEEYDAKVAFDAQRVKSKEHDSASESQEQYSYPTVRTVTSAHFDKALADISASISEDMSSLAAIRKFDEKYGDRRGRKKKGGLGFGMKSASDAERERREDGRVRREVLTEA